MTRKLHALVSQLAQQELDWQGRTLLAPVVAPGRARVRIQGLVHEFRVQPPQFSGFAVFELEADGRAHFRRRASDRERETYLRLWPRRRLRLLRQLQGKSWLACFDGLARMTAVHEVASGAVFELVECAFDGVHCWYRGPVLNTELQRAERMRQNLADRVNPAELKISGLTPEDRAAYACLHREVVWEGASRSPLGFEEGRLRAALARGGGELLSYSSDAEVYQVHWRDSLGCDHHSCIRRDDLTVVSSGICLSGRDADFDLTSLVGVMEEES